MISVSVIRTAQVDIPLRAVYRYLGYGRTTPDQNISALIQRCRGEVAVASAYQACWGVVPIHVTGTTVNLSILQVESRALSRNLHGCEQAILFAATLGAGVDQLRLRAEITSPTRALILDAVGTAAVEAWCDQLCEQFRSRFAEQGLKLRPRFSPGYGDLSLSLQRPLLDALRAPSRIGVSLTRAQLMVPQKSVSAIVGLSTAGCEQVGQDCATCSQENCAFRL